ncbi:MAG TPA: dihydroorotase family protein [Candidatus Dormibacteraeota bacterium]
MFTPKGFADIDVGVRDGQFVDGGSGEVVDCRGLWLLPGALDAHVHSRDPGFPDKEDWTSLTAAAAAGGVTTVLDMPNTVPAVDSAELLAVKAERAADRALVDFGLWGLVRSSSTPEQLAGLVAAGAVGLKAYLGYAYRRSQQAVTYTAALDDPDLEAPPGYGTIALLAPALARSRALLAVHAEDPELLRFCARPLREYADVLAARPALAEAIAIAAVGVIAAADHVRLHLVHISSLEGLAAADAARVAGADLSIETCPQYLWTTEDDFARVGNALRMNPPVRTRADQEALRRAVAAREVDIIATDHAPHTDEEKFGVELDRAHPGSPGVQTLLLSALQLTRVMGARDRLIRAVTANVADRFGFAGRKGVIAPGADADLVLVDPAAQTVVAPESMHSRQKHGVLEGMTFDFAIRSVYSRGDLVFSDGEVVGKPGRGRWLKPSAGGGTVFGSENSPGAGARP